MRINQIYELVIRKKKQKNKSREERKEYWIAKGKWRERDTVKDKRAGGGGDNKTLILFFIDGVRGNANIECKIETEQERENIIMKTKTRITRKKYCNFKNGSSILQEQFQHVHGFRSKVQKNKMKIL